MIEVIHSTSQFVVHHDARKDNIMIVMIFIIIFIIIIIIVLALNEY